MTDAQLLHFLNLHSQEQKEVLGPLMELARVFLLNGPAGYAPDDSLLGRVRAAMQRLERRQGPGA